MSYHKRYLKKRLCTMIALMAGIMLSAGFTAEEVSAASRKPGKVVLTSVKSSDYNAVKITWKRAKYAGKYQVYRATAKNGKYKLVKTTTAKSFTNKKLTTGKKYYYKVRALNRSKKGSFSNKKYSCPSLKKTAGLKAAGNTFTSVTVSWNKVNGASGYQVCRAASKNGKYNIVKATASRKCENTGLVKGSTYYYKVRAYRTAGKAKKYGAYSSVVSYKVPDLNSIRTSMLSKVNAERKKIGAAPLKLYAPINETAQIKAEDLYKTGKFNHYSTNLGWFYDQFNAAGIAYTSGAENIAAGQSSVSHVMKSWMNSPGHKANILNKKMTCLGVGYFKGYWVQQFTDTSVSGEPIVCPRCGKLIYTEKYCTSNDAEGNEYRAYSCTHCGYLVEKCPKCQTGYFQDTGITEFGSVARKCKNCGHNQTKTCIENCPFCNSKVLNNTESVKYIVTFDSEKQISGKLSKEGKNQYFQEMIIESDVCKSCGKFVRTDGQRRSDYKESMDKLRDVLDSSADIYACITWQKKVGEKFVGNVGDGEKYIETYEKIDTPRISDLNEIVGQKPF